MINKPLTGGYGCVDTGSNFFSQAIKVLTRSNYSHAFIVLDADSGEILEAEPEGARISNLSEYAHRELIFSKDAVKPSDAAEIMIEAEKLKGTPYGFTDILYLGLELGPGWRPKWLLDQVLDERNMICSQMVAYFGHEFGTDWNCGQPDAQLVTPGMLAARIR